MPIKFLFLLVCLLLQTGCVIQLHERTPQQDSSLLKEWQLRCEIAQSTIPTKPDRLRHIKGKWLWAEDANGNGIELAGELEDGFYVLNGLVNNDVVPSTKLFRQYCLTTLAAKQYADPATFIGFRAARRSEGVNLVGGAFTVDHKSIPGEGVIDRIKEEGQLFVSGSIDLQVSDYIKRQLSADSLKEAELTTFVLWTGANDYISKEPITGVIDTFLNSAKGAPGYKAMVDETILALERYILRLYAVGARRFILMDLPDLGETPIVLQNETYMKGNREQSDEQRRADLSKRLSELSADHNVAIQDMVARIEAQFDDVAIALVETSKHIAKISSQPNGFDYGFALNKNSKPLLIAGESKLIQYNCYAAGYLGTSKTNTVCDDQQSAMFWDVVHPTTFSHCWQAYMIAKDLAKIGWYGELAPLAEYKNWCKKIAYDNGVTSNKQWLLRGLTPLDNN